MKKFLLKLWFIFLFFVNNTLRLVGDDVQVNNDSNTASSQSWAADKYGDLYPHRRLYFRNTTKKPVYFRWYFYNIPNDQKVLDGLFKAARMFKALETPTNHLKWPNDLNEIKKTEQYEVVDQPIFEIQAGATIPTLTPPPIGGQNYSDDFFPYPIFSYDQDLLKGDIDSSRITYDKEKGPWVKDGWSIFSYKWLLMTKYTPLSLVDNKTIFIRSFFSSKLEKEKDTYDIKDSNDPHQLCLTGGSKLDNVKNVASFVSHGASTLVGGAQTGVKNIAQGAYGLAKMGGNAISKTFEGTKMVPGKRIVLQNLLPQTVYCRWFYDYPEDYRPGDVRAEDFDQNQKEMPSQIYTIEKDSVAITIVPESTKEGIFASYDRVLIVAFEKDHLNNTVKKKDDGVICESLESQTKLCQDQNQRKFIIKSFTRSNVWQFQAGLYQLNETNQGYAIKSAGSLITVNNQSDKDLWVGCYYKNGQESRFETELPIISIRNGSIENLIFPTQEKYVGKVKCHRVVLAFEKKDDAQKIISFQDSKNVLFEAYDFETYLGRLSRSINYEIVRKNNGFMMQPIGSLQHNWKEWAKTDKDLNIFATKIEEGTYALRTPENEPIIRTGKEVCLEEKNYLTKRLETNRKGLIKLGLELPFIYEKENNKDIPTISLTFTGGGFRAMTETIGFLRGAQDIGLFDAATYMTGLSGSTWAISAFVASGKDIKDFSDQLSKNISTLLNLQPGEGNPIKSYRKMLYTKYHYGQDFGMAGFYGAFVFNHLFGLNLENNILSKGAVTWGAEENINKTNLLIPENPHWLKLSHLQIPLENHAYPFPICTAISERVDEKETEHWFEFSPYEIGTWDGCGVFVKTPYAGSRFHNMVREGSDPEHPLSYYMGIWGSAYSVNQETVEVFAGGNAAKLTGWLTPHMNWLVKGSQKTKEDPARLLSSDFLNFTYKIDIDNAPLKEESVIHLVDGGHRRPFTEDQKSPILHNFGSVPVLQRKVNLLVLGDTEQALQGVDHLRATHREAQNLKLSFPEIDENDYEKILKISEDPDQVPCVCIFDEKPDTPVIVYMKGRKYNSYKQDSFSKQEKIFDPLTFVPASTANFVYTEADFDLLSGLTQTIMKDSAKVIKYAVKIAALKKSDTKLDVSGTQVFGVQHVLLMRAEEERFKKEQIDQFENNIEEQELRKQKIEQELKQKEEENVKEKDKERIKKVKSEINTKILRVFLENRAKERVLSEKQEKLEDSSGKELAEKQPNNELVLVQNLLNALKMKLVELLKAVTQLQQEK